MYKTVADVISVLNRFSSNIPDPAGVRFRKYYVHQLTLKMVV